MSIAILQRQYATFVAILIAVFASPALATSFAPDWYVCPLGGEKFSSMLRAEHYSKTQEEMKGTIVGPLATMPIVQCPNGFLIAKPNYSDDEIALIAILVSRPEYAALRKRPTYERLWWLRKAQGADPFELAELRFLADRELSVYRYDDQDGLARAYLQTIASLPFQKSRGFDWFRAYLRAVNILRERGRFAEAKQLLASINVKELKPPAKQVDLEVLALSELIDERNRERFPVTLGAPAAVAYTCLEADPSLTKSEQIRCDSNELRLAMKQVCRKFAGSESAQYAPEGCRQIRRINDIISALAIALALLFLALTFRGLNRS
jgi:hypothetical protein